MKKIIILTFLMFVLFSVSPRVEAAVLELRGPSQVAVGEKFVVSLYLNT